jgi:hypothetical protein
LIFGRCLRREEIWHDQSPCSPATESAAYGRKIDLESAATVFDAAFGRE